MERAWRETYATQIEEHRKFRKFVGESMEEAVRAYQSATGTKTWPPLNVLLRWLVAERERLLKQLGKERG